MPGYQNTLPSRTSVITDAWAKPKDASEMSIAFQGVIAALRGAWGTGPWDGGVEGLGYWEKHSFYWNAQLKFACTGTRTVTLPFKCINSVIKYWKCEGTTAVPGAYYLESGQEFPVTHEGTVVVELQMVKVVKS